jgi:hypothetical protein
MIMNFPVTATQSLEGKVPSLLERIFVVRLFLTLDQLQHFTGSRKSAQILLGKDELAAMFNLEDSPARLDQVGFDTQFFLQFLRQTGGFGSIISTTAVRDFAGLHFLLNLLRIDAIARRVRTRPRTDHN